MTKRADIYVCSSGGEFWQGEFLSDLVDYQWVGPGDEVVLVDHPLAVILSADCDLTQDFNARNRGDAAMEKRLMNILLCDAFPSDDLRSKSKASLPSTEKWNDVKKNKNERYQYLAEIPADKDAAEKGFGPLAMDFTNCFCISILHLLDQLNGKAMRRSRLNYPYAQHLAQRFYAFHARVGLPVDHEERKPPATGQPSGPATQR